jgi:hypothetical protein
MDKPSEPTHGPTKPIPTPHRRHVRSLEEATHSLDPPAALQIRPATTGIDPDNMVTDPLGRRRRQWRWRWLLMVVIYHIKPST